MSSEIRAEFEVVAIKQEELANLMVELKPASSSPSIVTIGGMIYFLVDKDDEIVDKLRIGNAFSAEFTLIE